MSRWVVGAGGVGGRRGVCVDGTYLATAFRERLGLSRD